jgi:small subunit ribosomal protein S1
MFDPDLPENATGNETAESFRDLLSQFERSHARASGEGAQGVQGTVIAVSAESVFLDIGYKTEGILPLADFQAAGESVKPGDKLLVTITGRGPEGYYELTRGKVARPTDWASLEKAFTGKEIIAGTVTGVVKGGLSVDVGVRAFMPASRTGTRDAAEMEKLVGQQIRCRITKLDVTEEDVVVDHRVIAEEEERAGKERRYAEIKEGETVSGEVRSLTDYGAFIDLGGVDGLLHVGDISWSRVGKPADVLAVGQRIDARVLKVDFETRRISLGMKQLLPHPWDAVPDKYKPGERVRGVVTRLAEFGAFVELEPGIEGLIHVSELSWGRRVKRPDEVVKAGDSVEAVILGVNTEARRISLGLKQALGDPWAEVEQRFPVHSVVEGPVVNLTKFGAFVQLTEGVEGMIHIGDITAERRLAHPQDMLHVGQIVKALVLEIDTEKRRVRLGMKQLLPTSLEEFIAEHQVGNSVTGRITAIAEGQARVELGEGIYGACPVAPETPASPQPQPAEAKADLSSLTSMLQARWKNGSGGEAQREAPSVGQVRSFKITKLDAAAKKIELAL